MAAWGERLAGVRGVLLDISGVLYDGGEGGGAPIPGSVEALASLGSPETPSPAGSSETHFLASRGISEDGRGFADVVVVATSEGMLSRVHGHTPHAWPAIPLCLILVVGTAGLQNGLVNAATSSHHTDHSSVGGGDDLLGAQGQLHSGLLCLRVVGDDSHIVPRGSGQLAPVTRLLLQTAHDGAPRYGTPGSTLPMLSWACSPQYTNWPVWMPSVVMNISVRFLKRYGSQKTTLARGMLQPGSWMMSFTVPLT
ncbi:phospholysine phosphohistidine inorganic pyrophosphate phosphatase isoform X3 [Mesoplodon densirostris]|uniref:phospholysine phosphohistidine inorganic pyrophosphate phosphatase isoform X3 n=1 Tax=Mesoplodon densirostris TaxID=48708 RepID=UPI0028DC3FBC|nr:phospholysine phosphohistidine inorganic pyrophosphate phosphatase isoform X3 [Mesoplodon densirostris]